MDLPLSPILLYGACALGAVGVAVSLPRSRYSLFVIGSIVAAAAFGGVLLGLGLAHPKEVPNIHFYLFGLIAMFGSIKVITHPRPVYSALYFVLTILASCGIYLLLSAEFLAFALVIVYAGAILITYLFVIMLATEAPSGDAVEALSEYDRVSREPVAATVAGFLVLAALSTALGVGSPKLRTNPEFNTSEAALAQLPVKVNKILQRARVGGDPAKLLVQPDETLMRADTEARDALVDAHLVAARDADKAMPKTRKGEPAYAIDSQGLGGWLVVKGKTTPPRVIPKSQWPEELYLSNTEGVAFELIAQHPGAIEIAGVVLLMAMLGAVVLARKKVEMDEQARAAAAQRVKSATEMGPTLGADAPFVPPAVGVDAGGTS